MRHKTMIGGALGTALFAAALIAAPGAAAAATLGSEAKPVHADMPAGQRAYLRRLRCADGNAPTYQRAGNVGPGPDGHIVDLYEVLCADSEPGRSEIYMDMYHGGHVEDEAVPGFAIVPG